MKKLAQKARIMWFEFRKWPALPGRAYDALMDFEKDPKRNKKYCIFDEGKPNPITCEGTLEVPFIEVLPGATSRDGGKTWNVQVKQLAMRAESVISRWDIEPVPGEQLQLLHDAFGLYPTEAQEEKGSSAANLLRHLIEGLKRRCNSISIYGQGLPSTAYIQNLIAVAEAIADEINMSEALAEVDSDMLATLRDIESHFGRVNGTDSLYRCIKVIIERCEKRDF